jgi:hypothetical protein
VHTVTTRVNLVAHRSQTVTAPSIIESSEFATGRDVPTTEQGIEVHEMTRTFLARAFTSVGSVIALAAVVGAGTKWW